MGEEVISEKALTLIGKIKAKQWKEMGKTVNELKDFTEAGGIASFSGQITDAITLQITDYLSPLTNEITTMINTALQPFLDDLVVIVNDLTAFIGEGAEGALIGGVVGSIASLFLPGGIILTAIGAIIGSAVQQFFESPEMKNWKNEMNQFFYDMFSDLMAGWKGFWTDVGAGWSGFWRDLGWE